MTTEDYQACHLDYSKECKLSKNDSYIHLNKNGNRFFIFCYHYIILRFKSQRIKKCQ
nr:MAG TPA: hypothetical protein [Caudoviricetes sp.]